MALDLVLPLVLAADLTEPLLDLAELVLARL